MTLLFSLILAKDEQPNFTKYCVQKDGVLKVIENCEITTFTPDIVVILNISLEMNKTGWMFMEAETNPSLTGKEQMLGLGYAEGFIFHESLANHQANIKEYFLKTDFENDPDYPDEMYQFYTDNMAWTRQMSQTNRDAYWKQVAYTMAHFDGLVLGYQQQANASSFLSELDLFMYMSSGDLLDVVKFAIPNKRHWLNRPELDELNDHCSGLVRVSGDKVFVSQVAWFTFGAMTRVSKKIKFNLGSRAKEIKFSSYPGFSYSFDDWYQTDSGLMVFETTDSVYVDELYELCSTESLMTWFKAPIASRLAADGEEFMSIIGRYNSGTYNNQWVVLDVKKFNQKSTADVLWISEQIPGKVSAYDATPRLLSEGYFPSYNNPSQLEIRLISGYPEAAAKNRSKDYFKSARAQIYLRDANKIETIEQMKAFMRYNDYLHDPLAYEPKTDSQEPADAIASRYDLRTDSRINCYGAFDAKIGEYDRATGKYTTHFISSPAYDNVPAFEFTDLWCPRRGLAEGKYMHEWVEDEVTLN
ncbi:Phospholipase_B [Hexamita inflata]|uniref:Phospholipase B-like n=1 Tax=Hexamita inflata TaxID=28002 RepID=A0AA86UXC8_9EUKA|nr:Phospholipase B [Hexamita inflata]CAI9968351.1 Phospholipase B [Hexamita inflata]